MSDGARQVGGVSFRSNLGIPNGTSRFGQARFAWGPGTLQDGFHSDDQVDDRVRKGLLVRYVDFDGIPIPPSGLTEAEAVALFTGGALDIEFNVGAGDMPGTSESVAPILATLVGVAPPTPGWVDFRSAGKLWALVMMALNGSYPYEIDPAPHALRLREAALAAGTGRGPVDTGWMLRDLPR